MAPETTLPDPQPSTPLPPRLALQPPEGDPVPLPRRGLLQLGHGAGCELRLSDPYVSRVHAEIEGCARGHRLVDRGSRNGTWVDGIAVEQAWLRPGMKLRVGRVVLRVVGLDRRGAAPPEPGTLLGDSPSLAAARARLERLATLPHPVLVRGETGTGKELAARLLHREGARRDAPLVAVNCAALPEQLAESELFGHMRGSFTGAHRDHDGAFIQAGEGTLFLDEVAELSLVVQAKLLRVLETRRVRPVGGQAEVAAPARIVAATHRDLERMVAEGDFRADLYHRLGVFSVTLPPLRERGEDMDRLARHFVALAARELGREVEPGPSFLAACRLHPWPGNVRELRNASLRAVALTDRLQLEARDLVLPPAPISGSIHPPTPSAAEPAPNTGRVPTNVFVIPRGDYRTMNRALLRQVVEEAGSVRKAARTLGVPRSTLGSWLRK